MKKEVYKINKEGYIDRILVAKFDEEGNCLEDLDSETITIPLESGLYLPRWTGVKWVEDMTQEEIDELNNQPKEPTELEIQQQIINALGQELTLLKLQIMMGEM